MKGVSALDKVRNGALIVCEGWEGFFAMENGHLTYFDKEGFQAVPVCNGRFLDSVLESEFWVLEDRNVPQWYHSPEEIPVPADTIKVVDKPKLTETQILISRKCLEIKELLLEKNRKYGDSALNPIRFFSKADAVEQILVRIDDKINRIKNRQNDEDEDVYQDLAGYLILLLVALDRKEN